MTIPQLVIPSPLQKITPSGLDHINLYIKRDDLIHPHISGNKWRKLKKTIEQFDHEKHTNIVTFGGAFSNHLVATAVACNLHKIPCTAYVRSESIDLNNPTLQICHENGMKLIPLSRSQYQQKTNEDFLNGILRSHPSSFIIPEGGLHPNALIGLADMMEEISEKEIEADIFLFSLGTGTMASGILRKMKKSQAWICPAINLFDSESMKQVYNSICNEAYPEKQVKIIYHDQSKPYAKKDIALFLQINTFLQETGILLDPIYTGKAWRILVDKASEIPAGSTVVWIHSGGVQAWKGYFYRFPALVSLLPDIYEQVRQL